MLVTRGRPTIIYPETLLTFRLEAPLTISTQRGQPAYRPVTQEDYDRDRPLHQQPRYSAGPAYPAPPPPPYYYDDYYYYPPPFYTGFYGQLIKVDK